MKNKISFATIVLLAIVMSACKQTATPAGGSQNNEAETTSTDSAAIVSTENTPSPAETLLTFAQAKAMVTPGQRYDEQSIDSLFTEMELSKIQAERYICDADYGGDSPAISYTWGKNVEFKNWKFRSTTNGYYGIHFNFFFDKTRRTGTIKQVEVITDSKEWYDTFMADAKTAGIELQGNINKAIYLRDGKEYSLKIDESSQYYLFDFSNADNYNIEFSYDDGRDL